MAKKKASKPSSNKPPKATLSKGADSSTSATRAAFTSNPSVILPKAGEWTLSNTTASPYQIPVLAGPYSDGTLAYAKFHAVGASPSPLPTPAELAAGTGAGLGFELLVREGASAYRYKAVTTANAGATATPAANNLEVTVVSVAPGSTTTDLTGIVGIKYVGNGFQFSVHGYCCPWFAFRADGDGPKSEAIEVHRPVKLRLPINAKTLTVVSSAGTWQHAPVPAAVSDAAGYGGPWGLWEPAYQTDSNAGTSYLPIELPAGASPRHNLLIGVLEPRTLSTLETTPARILPIGHGSVSLAPGASRYIHLGMWDGGQWTKDVSNSGTVTLTINWEADV